MNCITMDSGPDRIADSGIPDSGIAVSGHGGGETGVAAGLRHAARGLVSACRSAAALATMSERELDDLGLLPSEVRSGIDRAPPAERRRGTLDCCNQA